MVESGKGELELLEVFMRGHKLWGLQVSVEVMGQAVNGLDEVGDES